MNQPQKFERACWGIILRLGWRGAKTICILAVGVAAFVVGLVKGNANTAAFALNTTITVTSSLGFVVGKIMGPPSAQISKERMIHMSIKFLFALYSGLCSLFALDEKKKPEVHFWTFIAFDALIIILDLIELIVCFLQYRKYRVSNTEVQQREKDQENLSEDVETIEMVGNMRIKMEDLRITNQNTQKELEKQKRELEEMKIENEKMRAESENRENELEKQRREMNRREEETDSAIANLKEIWQQSQTKMIEDIENLKCQNRALSEQKKEVKRKLDSIIAGM